MPALVALFLIAAPFAIPTGPAFAAPILNVEGRDRHGDPVSGARRIETAPAGDCAQCHVRHGEDFGPAYPVELFTGNDNQLCYTTQSLGGCHADLPLGYPARESDRLPEGVEHAGYFEANSAGVRLPGVEYRVRWPGAGTFETAMTAPNGHAISPHATDPDMPRQDEAGRGLCLACHVPHGSENPFDLLRSTYLNGGGSASSGPPANFQLCFDCHSSWGPSGMEQENRQIADYYDRGQNPDNAAGHQIRRNPRIALSWPASVRIGDMLSCSDCHNPHGSRGNDGVNANAFCLSDERPGWSGLTDPLNDAAQSRRFCLGCHIASDGLPGSQTVRGIVMNTLSGRDAHRAAATEACNACHGADYSGPQSYNAHHPAQQP